MKKRPSRASFFSLLLPANPTFCSRIIWPVTVEIGSNLNEIERFTTNQTQVLTMTEVEGYAIIDSGACKTLDVKA